jgi:hypothetical protein
VPRISFPVVETKILVDKEIKAGDRTLFIVTKISILKTQDGAITGSWLTPFAMLIIEPGKQYAISINGERMSVDAILDLAPSLKIFVENIRTYRKIKID